MAQEQAAGQPQASGLESIALHHVAGRLRTEDVRRQPEPEWTRDDGAERLALLDLLELLRNTLDQLLELLQLRWHDLKKQLKLQGLLVLNGLQLLKLLRDDLQQL
jgi:hypothetical protein